MNKTEEYKNKDFIIAEIFGCASFILNTICVVTADRGGPFAPAWVPKFNLIYWLKTISAAIGFFYFFISGVFSTKQIPRYISISTLIILGYSIPIINTVFLLPFVTVFKSVRGSSFEYEDRIAVQIIWFIPVLIVAIDILIKSLKVKKK